jgi:hypothetical protein
MFFTLSLIRMRSGVRLDRWTGGTITILNLLRNGSSVMRNTGTNGKRETERNRVEKYVNEMTGKRKNIE